MDAFSMVFRIQGAEQDHAIFVAFAILLVSYALGALLLRWKFRGRKWLWAAFNLGYVAVFFASLEIVTRLWGPPPHPLLDADASRVWRLRPHLDTAKSGNTGEFNVVITNADGWRNRDDIAREHPASSLRVVCVGDSWMYGFRADQDDTIPAVLATDLQKMLPSRKIEVINAGVFGYGTGQTLATLQQAMAWHPDVVVVGMLHNINARAAAMHASNAWESALRSVLLQSRFYLWLRVQLQDRGRERDASAFDRARCEEARRDYGDMADLAHQSGAMCVFIEYKLPPDDWPDIHKVEKAGNHNRSLFEEQMAEVAQEKHCVLVPCSYCEEPNGTEMTDLTHDKFHPNPHGYHWIADRTARAIVDHLEKRP